MGFEINCSNTPENARSTRKSLLKSGVVEVYSLEEAVELESRGKMTFIDHTNNGANCFSEAEMDDFRRTPIENFPEHQRRWGK